FLIGVHRCHLEKESTRREAHKRRAGRALAAEAQRNFSSDDWGRRRNAWTSRARHASHPSARARPVLRDGVRCRRDWRPWSEKDSSIFSVMQRSEEHTSELQSRGHLVCRLLLEKKKQ